MKTKKLLLSALMVCLLCIAFSACKKKPADELLQILSRPHLPFSLTAESVQTLPEKDGQLIAFQNGTMRINPEFLEAINPGIKDITDALAQSLVFPIAEIQFLYIPGKKLELKKIRGLTFSLNAAQLASTHQKIPAPFDLRMDIPLVTFSSSDLTPFIDRGITDSQSLFLALLSTHSQYQSSLEHFKIEMRFSATKTANAVNRFVLEAQSMTFNQMTAPEFIASFTRSQKENWITRALEDNQDIINLSMAMKNLSLKGFISQGKMTDPNQKSAETFAFKTESLSFAYKLAPNMEKTAFHLSTDTHVSGLRLELAAKPALGKIIDFPLINMDFSLSPISGRLITLYLDMNRRAMEINRLEDEARQQALATILPRIMAIRDEFMRSRPQLHFTLDPLKHPWTELRGRAHFSLPSPKGPVGFAEMTVTRAEELLQNLVTQLEMNREDAAAFYRFIETFLVLDAEGMARMRMDMKEEAPGKPVFNTRPQTK